MGYRKPVGGNGNGYLSQSKVNKSCPNIILTNPLDVVASL